MVFDLSGHLHLPAYLRFLIESWCARDGPGELSLVVTPPFARSHPDVVVLAGQARRGNVRVLTLTEGEHRRSRSPAHPAEPSDPRVRPSLVELLQRSPGVADWSHHWVLLHRYAEATRATHSLIVHLDGYLPLLAGGAALPGSLSGIFFGPAFHYGRIGSPPRAPQERTEQLHQKFVLARALRHERLRHLFMLDPFAVEDVPRVSAREKVRFLPDPVPPNRATAAEVATLRARLGVDSGRAVLLLFGHLTPRKGGDELLDALGRLPEDRSRALALVLAGVVRPDYRPELERRAAALRARRPIQVIERFGFVSQEDVPAYFRLADIVLAPYPRHAGMSGVLLLAAAAGTPVLSGHYGLMGEYVRRHRLGVAVDAADPEAIAAGLERLLARGATNLVDPDAMRRLAERHDSRHFGAMLLGALLTA
jgi:glycosyltransferase involved in cell wall biosynthesis